MRALNAIGLRGQEKGSENIQFGLAYFYTVWNLLPSGFLTWMNRMSVKSIYFHILLTPPPILLLCYADRAIPILHLHH